MKRASEILDSSHQKIIEIIEIDRHGETIAGVKKQFSVYHNRIVKFCIHVLSFKIQQISLGLTNDTKKLEHKK